MYFFKFIFKKAIFGHDIMNETFTYLQVSTSSFKEADKKK